MRRLTFRPIRRASATGRLPRAGPRAARTARTVAFCLAAVVAASLAACQTQQSQIDEALELAGHERKSLEIPPDSVLAQKSEQQPAVVDAIATGSVKAGGESGQAKVAGDSDRDGGDTIAAYVPPKPGTVLHFRNNWATLPAQTMFRVDPPAKIGDKEYVRLTAVGGSGETLHGYYDASNYALKGYRDDKDAAVITYKPVEERYRFPMHPGDKWLSQWRSISHRDKKVSEGGGVVQVVRMETIDLPAGKFRAMKVRLPLPASEFPGMSHFIWFSPELGVTIKEEITNGRINWTQVLEKVELPAG